jgi:hypothetical protein
MRQALGLLPDFINEGVQRPLKKTGLNLTPMRDRATQMGIKHLTVTWKKTWKEDLRLVPMFTAY